MAENGLGQGPPNEANGPVSPPILRSLYVSMLRIRLAEEAAVEMLEKNEIHCPTHLYIGQEAVAAGVCAALRRDDYVFGTHRSHGHYLAKGGNLNAMMAELLGKATGCSKGRGGSMHLFAPEVGILGTVPLVSATIPIAVGTALTAWLQKSDRVSVTFFGDGAVEEGTFHESMNFAALKKLPVIFACENNFFASHLPLHERRAKDNIVDCAAAHAMPGYRVDGNDVIEVYRVTREAVARARAGEGPTFFEFRTYRWRGHVGPSWDLDVGIRDQQELDQWMARCPIKTLARRMEELGLLAAGEEEQIKTQAVEEVREAVRFARESPYPDEKEMPYYVFKD